MFAGTFLLLATAAAGAQAAPDRTPPAKPAAPKRICRSEVPTGSIMPGRTVCLTAAEWKHVGEAGDKSADAFRSRPVRAVDQRVGD